MKYTYEGNNAAAHQRAVLEKKIEKQYCTSDIQAAWAVLVTRHQTPGVSRFTAMRLASKADPELYAAVRGPRPRAGQRARVV